jgi:hypothetical protein
MWRRKLRVFMSKNAAEPVILILGCDKDFAYPLAEQIEAILQLPCVVAENYQAAQPLKPTLALVVSSDELPKECPLPAVALGQPPFIMRELLQQIDAAHRKLLGEDVVLGGGYQLQPRAKILIHMLSARTVALTDKKYSYCKT